VTEPDIAYLNHILDAITHIGNFSSGISSADELRDHPLQRAGIERMLTVIGEAAKNVSPATKKRYLGVPWKATAGMRDKLIHHYFGVDYEAVWKTVTADLPMLKEQIRSITAEITEKKKQKK
jgi:uncharacterized protein with HEPN domain